MAGLTLRGVRKAWGKTEVLHGIDLEIPDGEFVVFVGPSGCGKSTLLRLICGLDEVSEGQIAIEGEIVNDVPPAKRGVAMVFQSYALYPHMSVAENMGYSLRLAGVPKAEITAKVRGAAAVLRLDALLDRKPRQLSGGQRQRVAIGRAIVREPRLFLFDEPLSNLDAALRIEMRAEIARLKARLGTTMVYVTHDQTEAMTLADRIVVMHGGRVEQAGPPLELYRRPANRFVAGFIGAPRMNLLPVAGSGEGTLLLCGAHVLGAPALGATELGIRPEDIRLAEPGTTGANPGGIPGEVVLTEHLGADLFVHCAVQGAADPVVVRLQGESGVRVGSRVVLMPDLRRLHRFGADGVRIDEPARAELAA